MKIFRNTNKRQCLKYSKIMHSNCKNLPRKCVLNRGFRLITKWKRSKVRNNESELKKARLCEQNLLLYSEFNDMT